MAAQSQNTMGITQPLRTVISTPYRSEETRMEEQLDAANAVTRGIISSRPFGD
jgi:hypothetical protein